jgi:hypothetical protein
MSKTIASIAYKTRLNTKNSKGHITKQTTNLSFNRLIYIILSPKPKKSREFSFGH